jgi:hypothetical protein
MKVRKALVRYLPLFLVIALAAGAYYYFFVVVTPGWEPCTYDEDWKPTCKLPPDEPQDFDEWENEGWCGIRIDNETWANSPPWQRRDYRNKKEDWKKRGKCPGDPGYYSWGSDSGWGDDYADEPSYSGGCDKQTSASLLGVSVDATKSQVKSAFREKSKSAHPDRNPGDPTAESRFRALSDAQDCLLGK